MTWIQPYEFLFLCLETGIRIEKCKSEIILKTSEYDNESSLVYEPKVRMKEGDTFVDDAWEQLRKLLKVKTLKEDKSNY